MKLADVLVKPILSEKANQLSEKSRVYSFRVARFATKLEIKKAVEDFYGVAPAKSKSRMTKAGVISGRKPSYKKAFVTVGEGDTIDLYANI
jgi:large subunit ribosomal protein L23